MNFIILQPPPTGVDCNLTGVKLGLTAVSGVLTRVKPRRREVGRAVGGRAGGDPSQPVGGGEWVHEGEVESAGAV